jgi:hypothetical protein
LPSGTASSRTETPSTVVDSAQPRGPASLLSIDFSTPQDGVIAFDRGSYGDGDDCAVEAVVTTDFGRSFGPPLLLARRVYCGAASPSVALAPGGTGWAVVAGRLWVISSDWQTWRLAPVLTAVLGPTAARLAACSAVLHGAMLWVTACPANETVPSFLLRSTNDGRTWTVSRIARSPGSYRPGDSGAEMALSSSSTGAILGCVTMCTTEGASGSVDLSTTDDGGRSWRDHEICGRSYYRALVAVLARNLTVACLGPESDGAQAISVVSSNDRGRSWREMCANGFFAVGPERATCPSSGYPGSLVETSDGTLLMGLDRGGVDTSTDGGATWRQTLSIPGGAEVDVASVGADGWAVSPSATGAYVSTNGCRSWVELPFRSG